MKLYHAWTAVLIVVCGWACLGIFKGIQQNDYRTAYRKACEEAGGVYVQPKSDVPQCFAKSAIVQVPK